jgi:hypothetical protein
VLLKYGSNFNRILQRMHQRKEKIENDRMIEELDKKGRAKLYF